MGIEIVFLNVVRIVPDQQYPKVPIQYFVLPQSNLLRNCQKPNKFRTFFCFCITVGM